MLLMRVSLRDLDREIKQAPKSRFSIEGREIKTDFRMLTRHGLLAVGPDKGRRVGGSARYVNIAHRHRQPFQIPVVYHGLQAFCLVREDARRLLELDSLAG